MSAPHKPKPGSLLPRPAATSQDLQRAPAVKAAPALASQPHAEEAERGLLGALLLDPANGVSEAVKLIGGPDALYDTRHQVVLRRLITSVDAGIPVDIVSLTQQLRDAGEEQDAGGVAYLHELLGGAYSSSSVGYYCEVVLEKAQLRRMLRVALDAVGTIREGTIPAGELLDRVERSVLEVRQGSGAVETTVKQLVIEVIQDIETRHAAGGALGGLPTGFADLDQATDGMHGGEMIILAAYPGVGKTALALNVVEHVAIDQKMPVGIFSLEMSPQSLVLRLVCSRARVNARNVPRGKLMESDFSKLSLASSDVARSGIHIDAASNLSIGELRARARHMVQRHGCKLLVIDYLQLLTAPGESRKTETRQQEVSAISRGIKAMTRELGVPIIALSQLNDDGKLYESRAMEQDADTIWILQTKEDAESTEKGGKKPTAVAAGPREVRLTVKKQRHGPAPVVVNLMFLGEYTRFESIERRSDTE